MTTGRIVGVASGALEVASGKADKDAGGSAEWALALDCLENGMDGKEAFGVPNTLLDRLDVTHGPPGGS